ncbi:MAG: prenyltransferase/squalene oxidase repeat-containing protein [Planctomycetaceae bacterium]
MTDDPYLISLGTRVAAGLARLEPERRERHRRFILSRQLRDGGFKGREGDSDLYYTGFAVRGLAVLGGLSAEEAQQVGSFLASFDWRALHVIDLISWLYSALVTQTFGGPDLFANEAADWAEQIALKLESVRTPDGGYAKSAEGSLGSTYHSFLTVMTYELLGRQPPKPKKLGQFLFDRQRDDGGFVEIAPMKTSGTNPTAAAAVLLRRLGFADEQLTIDLRDFIKLVRSDEGGFQANTRIPFADGLSTFTTLLVAQDFGLTESLNRAAIEAFIAQQLEFPTGGFRGASWDEQADVEYTFYGLGVLGLLGVVSKT